MNPADVPRDGHSVGFEWRPCRSAQDRPRGHIELGAVVRAGHRPTLELSLAQWSLPVRAPGLRRAEDTVDVEHGGVTDEQRRTRWYVTRAEFVVSHDCHPR